MHNKSNGSLIIHRHLEPSDYMFEWCCQRRPLRRVRRKTKREMAALLVVRRNTGQISAQTSTKKPGQDSKSVNVTLSNNDGHLGMVICLQYFQFVSPPIGGLTLGPIFMCVLMCLCFLAAYKYEIHTDAQLDFSGTAQNVQMVRVLHNNTSSCTIHRMVL